MTHSFPDEPALPLLDINEVSEYCATNPGVFVALVGPAREPAQVLWDWLLTEADLSTDIQVTRSNGREAVRWPNGSEVAIWTPQRGRGRIVDAIVIGARAHLTDEWASELRAASCTGLGMLTLAAAEEAERRFQTDPPPLDRSLHYWFTEGAKWAARRVGVPRSVPVPAEPDAAAKSAALRYIGTRASASALEWEEAVSRVVAIGGATTEHLIALADLVAAGIQPYQLRLMAQALASPLGQVPTTPPRHG